MITIIVHTKLIFHIHASRLKKQIVVSKVKFTKRRTNSSEFWLVRLFLSFESSPLASDFFSQFCLLDEILLRALLVTLQDLDVSPTAMRR